MTFAQEVKHARKQIDLILTRLEHKAVEQDANINGDEVTSGQYESIYPLAMGGTRFKGAKPTGLLFSEERVDVSTWKAIFQEILRRCNSDPEKHVALMNLRGKAAGKTRQFLAKEPSKMRTPHKIADNLFVETHYDTETLFKILMTRILDPVGYDYSDICVAILD